MQNAPSRPPASGSFFSSRCIASFFYSFLVRQVRALRDLRFPLLLAVIRAPVLVGFHVSVLSRRRQFLASPRTRARARSSRALGYAVGIFHCLACRIRFLLLVFDLIRLLRLWWWVSFPLLGSVRCSDLLGSLCRTDSCRQSLYPGLKNSAEFFKIW
jgi:hypothetical protein